MTTFESIVCLAVTAIVIILAFGIRVIIKKLNHIAIQHKSTWSHFDNVVCQLYGIKETINSIYNAIGADGCNNFKKLSELTDIVDKMHRNLCVEIADKMVDRVYPPTHATPCYAPDNIRKWDCVNCPKRSTCDSCTTPTRTIKVKGKRCELTDEELMKRINEDNKED